MGGCGGTKETIEGGGPVVQAGLYSGRQPEGVFGGGGGKKHFDGAQDASHPIKRVR